MVPWSCRGGRVCSCDDMHNDGVLTPWCVLGRSRADTLGPHNICHTSRMSAVPRSRPKLLLDDAGLNIIGTMAGADQMNLRLFKVSDPPSSFQVMVERTSSQRS